jgi:hypothetical protein
MYSTVVVAIGRRLPRAASLAAYSTALATLVAVPLLSDATAQRVDDLLLRTGAGRLLLYLAVMTNLSGFFLTTMLATNQWALRHQLALGGTGVLVVCGVLLWIDVQTLDLPDMVTAFYGIRAGRPPPVLWMNIVIGLSIVYISVWGFLEFLRFLRSARHMYEQVVAGGVVVLYTLTGIQGLFNIVEAVGHNRGVDMAVVHQVNVLSKICVPAASCCFLIGQFWLWPLWRHRRQILARYVEPELVQLRNDLLNLSAAEAELHLDIHHEAYANRTIVEEVAARCRTAGLSPARTARARMAASLITFQRENVIQDPSYGLVTSWDALMEDAAAEIDQAMATTAWEKALREASVYQHVYIIMFLVLVLQLYLRSCASFIVPIFGYALMHPPPCRPGQQLGDGLLPRQHEPPEEPPNFGHTQRYPTPRVALKAARLLGRESPPIFLGASSGGKLAARNTVNSA